MKKINTTNRVLTINYGCWILDYVWKGKVGGITLFQSENIMIRTKWQLKSFIKYIPETSLNSEYWEQENLSRLEDFSSWFADHPLYCSVAQKQELLYRALKGNRMARTLLQILERGEDQEKKRRRKK